MTISIYTSDGNNSIPVFAAENELGSDESADAEDAWGYASKCTRKSAEERRKPAPHQQ